MRSAAALLLLAGCDLVFFYGVDEPVPPAPDEWRMIDAGINHVCAIRYDNSLWCWGAGGTGQLGEGTTRDQLVPARVEGSWRTVAAAERHTCAIATDGSLACWGAGEYGQLGGGMTPTFVLAPARVGTASWKAIAVAAVHSCGIQSDDSLWCWGRDGVGRLGLGPVDQTGQPPGQVLPGTRWSEVSVGTEHTCAIASDGSLWCWGSNEQLQHGTGVTEDVIHEPRRVDAAVGWSQLTVGHLHTCALRDGAAYCWGFGSDGQIGDEMIVQRRGEPTLVRGGPFVKLSAGTSHTCGVGKDGTLACWGANELGELAIDDPSGRPYPDVRVVATELAFTDVSAGGEHTCAISKDRDVYCTGSNARGELGDGLGGPRLEPVEVAQRVADLAVGGRHTCAIVDSELRCWGANGRGQLADPTLLSRQVPQFATMRTGDIATGLDHTCQRAGTQLWCWGSNAFGQIGRGGAPMSNPTAANATPFEVVQDGTSGWTTVTAGAKHTCGLHPSTTAACWGNNDAGQLGTGDTTSRTSPTLIGGLAFSAIDAGDEHTCGLRASDGAVQCWGRGGSGQLGNGTNTIRTSPTLTTPTLTARKVSAGGEHTCAIAMTADLYCWGQNSSGQLGTGALSSELAPLKLPDNWKAVSAGGTHTCAIRSDDALYCWGGNRLGQLGDGTSVARALPTPVMPALKWSAVQAGRDATCAVTLDDRLYCWGSNEHGQVGDGAAWRGVLSPIAPTAR